MPQIFQNLPNSCFVKEDVQAYFPISLDMNELRNVQYLKCTTSVMLYYNVKNNHES